MRPDVAANAFVEELFAAACKERILKFERLKDRVSKGSYEKFRQVISMIRQPSRHRL